MENSARYRDTGKSVMPSPSSFNTETIRPPTRPRYFSNHVQTPTTFVQTDPASFKQVVQMLTGYSKETNSPNPTHQPGRTSSSHSLPPIKSVSYKKQSDSRLNDRRNPMKHLKITPINDPIHSGSSSILDSPSPKLSPVTPLMPQTFYRPGSSNQSLVNPWSGHYYPKPIIVVEAEERAIKEKRFYLHPLPWKTRRGPPPRLLPLFPVTPTHVSDSFPTLPYGP